MAFHLIKVSFEVLVGNEMRYRDQQLEELEVVTSVLGESNVQVLVTESNVCGKIQISLEPLQEPITLTYTDCGTNDLKRMETHALPHCSLLFQFPEGYPEEEKPTLAIESLWIDEKLKANIEERLSEVCTENLGFPVLFFCSETITDQVVEYVRNASSICLDNNPYMQKYKITSADLVRRLKSSSEQVEEDSFKGACYDCEVCAENKMGSDCVKFSPCGHVFCKDCVSAFYVAKISQQIRVLECLSDGCDTVAPQSIVKNAVGEEQYERYERILLESALSNMSDVVPCARPSCQKPVLLSQSTPWLGECMHCEFSFCVRCGRTYHGLNPCQFAVADKKKLIDTFYRGSESEKQTLALRFGGMSRLQRVVEGVESETWIAGYSKPCPKCKVAIEKSEGCNKVVCSRCKIIFCWLCTRIISSEDPYSHFSTGTCDQKLFEGVVPDYDDWVVREFDDDSDEEYGDFEDDEGEDELEDGDVQVVFQN